MAPPSDTSLLDDPRISSRYVRIPGTDITYHYLLCGAEGGSRAPAATIVLFHGFPDLAIGWRYQIPYLLSLNLRVVAPDMLGYGQTSAPAAREEYTYKRMCGHMAYLIGQLVPAGEKVLLGGHDWGGYMAWRMAMWHPELFLAVFSLAVHFTPPTAEPVSLDDLVARLPSLRYQQQLAGPDLERRLDADPALLRRWLHAIYGGALPPPARANQGLGEAALRAAGPSPLLSPAMAERYAAEYARHGVHGPFNWYRVRDLNWADERRFLWGRPGDGDSNNGGGGGPKAPHYSFHMPAMLLMAERDIAFPPRVASRQQRFFEAGLAQGVLDSGHWVMIERPDEVNAAIGDFVKGVLGADRLQGKL